MRVLLGCALVVRFVAAGLGRGGRRHWLRGWVGGWWCGLLPVWFLQFGPVLHGLVVAAGGGQSHARPKLPRCSCRFSSLARLNPGHCGQGLFLASDRLPMHYK
ncbi:hypothetical protein [uncultured Nostoc sp.]|uniref:hypothetical protein n=1 Tax=uncultured Nostoc sp. TaxID=340711 RepID=UPI0035CAA00E